VNATVIYQPRLGLPAQPNPMNVPFPNTGKENFTSPFPLHVVMPAFPLEGMAGGTVVMQAALEADGTVRSIQVLSGPPSLLESAVASLKTWQFYVPDKLDAASRTAVVVAYFQSPEFGTSMSDNPAEILAEATLTRGTSPGVPVGAHGNLAAGTSNLSFRYADSHWVIPYSLITNIRYSVIPDSEDHLMTITYSGVDSEQTIFFRVKGDAGLSAASVVSSRSGRVIDFGKVIS
jgi:hypothetical protein